MFQSGPLAYSCLQNIIGGELYLRIRSQLATFATFVAGRDRGRDMWVMKVLQDSKLTFLRAFLRGQNKAGTCCGITACIPSLLASYLFPFPL